MRTVALCTLVFGFFAVLGFATAAIFGVLRDSRHRGEVAEVPEPLPVWQGCRLNATPHWCFDGAGAIAAMEKQLTDVKVPRSLR